MTDDPTFTPAGEADLEVLYDFMRRLRTDDPEEGPLNEAASFAALRRLIADPSLGRVWLVRVSGEPAGYAVLCFGYSVELGGRDAFIDELFVAESHRGRGIGRRALGFLQAAAAELGVVAVHLEVTRSNARARRLYAAAGFVDREHSMMTKRFAAENGTPNAVGFIKQ